MSLNSRSPDSKRRPRGASEQVKMPAENTSLAIPLLVSRTIDVFAGPVCAGTLRVSDNSQAMECSSCSQSLESKNGIPLLFWPNEWDSKTDVTDLVKSFYEQTPFPNYEDVDSKWSLREKAELGVFARLLDGQIPHAAKVLDAGCGTGQLSNFLGLTWGRTVFGADLSLNSLKLGQKFKQENRVDNTAFVQMNLFRPVFKPKSFDLVICSGVLHHTSDPLLAFQSISKLVRNDGHIIVGLYNRLGRIPTDIRRLIFRVSSNHFKLLDSRLRDKGISETRRHTWFMDQYKHPHESKHTIGEVMKWFESMGFEFVNSIPKATAFDSFAPDEQLFATNPRGTWLDHFIVQAGMLLGGGREGGFFLMMGRKVLT